MLNTSQRPQVPVLYAIILRKPFIVSLWQCGGEPDPLGPT